MAKWVKPSEALPECDCGDRVVAIVKYSVPYNDGFGNLKAYGPIQPHVVVFVATEDGFQDTEDSGFGIHDCELWTLERDLIKTADESSTSPADCEGETGKHCSKAGDSAETPPIVGGMAAMQHVFDVFGQLRKVIDLPEQCREVTIRLSIDEVPTVTAVYFPNKGNLADGTVTKRFRLVPLPGSESDSSR